MAVSDTSLQDITCDHCGAVEVVAIRKATDLANTGYRGFQSTTPLPAPPAGWVRVQWPSGTGLMIDLCGRCAAGVTLAQVASMKTGYAMNEVVVLSGVTPWSPASADSNAAPVPQPWEQ